MGAAQVRVAMVDDHAVIAMAVRGLVESEPALAFVGHAETVSELFRKVGPADLVILDLRLRDGSEAVRNVERIRAWGAQVVVLTSGEDPYLIREVSRADVLGIVRKSAPPATILGAIAAAARGDSIATAEWAAALDTDPDIGSAPLTAREREVLALYASGLGAKQVASRLGLSENTIDDHLRRIRAVYHAIHRPANTKVELYQRGVEDGFLPGPTAG